MYKLDYERGFVLRQENTVNFIAAKVTQKGVIYEVTFYPRFLGANTVIELFDDPIDAWLYVESCVKTCESLKADGCAAAVQRTSEDYTKAFVLDSFHAIMGRIDVAAAWLLGLRILPLT